VALTGTLEPGDEDLVGFSARGPAQTPLGSGILVRVTWDATRLSDVADAYLKHYRLSTGDRSERERAEDYWWSYDVVTDGVTDGSLPLDVIDVLIHHPDGDDSFRGYVAAGPIEDALTHHPVSYGPMIAARCSTDATWADTVEGVWLNDHEWSALPEDLRLRIPVHSVTSPPPPGKKARAKKASKRQGSRSRGPSPADRR